jgi:hypothetical protein
MRDGEAIKVDVTGPLTVHLGGATDLLVDVAIAGTGIVPLFEDWLRPHFQSDALSSNLGGLVRGAVSLFPWTAACSDAAAGLCRFHQGVSHLIGLAARGASARLRRREFASARPDSRSTSFEPSSSNEALPSQPASE